MESGTGVCPCGQGQRQGLGVKSQQGQEVWGCGAGSGQAHLAGVEGGVGRNLGGGTWKVVGGPIGESLFERTMSQWKGFEQANDVMDREIRQWDWVGKMP